MSATLETVVDNQLFCWNLLRIFKPFVRHGSPLGTQCCGVIISVTGMFDLLRVQASTRFRSLSPFIGWWVVTMAVWSQWSWSWFNAPLLNHVLKSIKLWMCAKSTIGLSCRVNWVDHLVFCQGMIFIPYHFFYMNDNIHNIWLHCRKSFFFCWIRKDIIFLQDIVQIVLIIIITT